MKKEVGRHITHFQNEAQKYTHKSSSKHSTTASSKGKQSASRKTRGRSFPAILSQTRPSLLSSRLLGQFIRKRTWKLALNYAKRILQQKSGEREGVEFEHTSCGTDINTDCWNTGISKDLALSSLVRLLFILNFIYTLQMRGTAESNHCN